MTATDSITISYGYDAAGNRTRYTDGRGNSTVYTLNTLGLPEKVIEPSTTAHPAAADRTWTASYDAAGNAVSLLSPGGVAADSDLRRGRTLVEGRRHGRGGLNRDSRPRPMTSAGRVATTSSLDGVNTYTYNDRGMLLRADGPSGTSTQGYDPDGQLTQRIDAAGTADFTYTNGRPATVTDPVTRTLQTLGYNAAGQLVDDRLRLLADPHHRVRRLRPDELRRTEGRHDVGARPITYGYDADNNVTSKKTTGVAGAGDNTYAYDQLGRLTSWTKGTTTTAVRVGRRQQPHQGRHEARDVRRTQPAHQRRHLDVHVLTARRPALQDHRGGTTTEAFTFDAFDRMIRTVRPRLHLRRPRSPRPGRHRPDALRRLQRRGRLRRHPVLRPLAPSDGLLSVGYDTTKRLVLADRHGDVIAGFDPTDTTLSAGLPDTRTYDPFGNSTSATGLKYRVGYQGDWTDPRSGDVNQGARWYNPGTGTFNSRDTITYDAGVASSRPQPVRLRRRQPAHLQRPRRPPCSRPRRLRLKRSATGYARPSGWTSGPICHYEVDPPDEPEPEPDCKKTGKCDGKCDGKGKGETNCGGEGGCKGKNCDGEG